MCCIFLHWQIGPHNYILQDPRISCPGAKGCHLALPLGELLEHMRAPRDLAASVECSASSVLPSTCPLPTHGWHTTSHSAPAANTAPAIGDWLKPVKKERSVQTVGFVEPFQTDVEGRLQNHLCVLIWKPEYMCIVWSSSCSLRA